MFDTYVYVVVFSTTYKVIIKEAIKNKEIRCDSIFIKVQKKILRWQFGLLKK